MGFVRSRIASAVKGGARAVGFEISRQKELLYSQECVTLPAIPPLRGRCLIAYILKPFLTPKEVDRSHTHFRESLMIASVWQHLGFEVDVIDYRNPAFQPKKTYDYFVSARKYLAEISERLNKGCVKIAHLDVAQFATCNRSAYQRLVEFQDRHGVSVPKSLRPVEHNLGIDAADVGVLLGNGVTQSSYEYSQKPLYRLSVPATQDWSWQTEKNFEACRHHFIWMGSGGLLQKGLDIALEAFLGMPELKLTVCGPTLNEPRFMEVYAKSLRDCGNIEILGWVDVGSKTFEDLRLRSLAIVYPSSTEGQAGAVINCMRAGLIPIVSKETGVDVDGFGEMLAGCSVEQVQKTVRAVSSCSAAELERRARGAWCYAERFHSHESYIAQYDSIIRNIIKNAEKRPESV